MDPHTLRAFYDELEQPMLKQALIERLIRLGATDLEDLPGVRRVVSKTPRLLMKKRSPEELHALQAGVQGFFDRYEKPAIAKAEKLLEKVPHAGARKALNAGASTLIKNPELLATEALPGGTIASAGWLAAKRGLERGIDRVAPTMLPPLSR